MEESWNLKINEKSWNFGIRFLSGCQYRSIFSLYLCLLDNLKEISFSFLMFSAIKKYVFFIIKQNFSYLFNYLCNISIVCLLCSIIWPKEGSKDAIPGMIMEI